jgi:flagellar hook-associated protein 2
MATLTAGGIGSGLDINALVSQLVAAERAPVATRLDRQEAQVQAKISAFGTLRSALAQLQGALRKLTKLDDFLVRRATSGDEGVFTASASSRAAPGTYSVQVERLAQAHKVLSTGFAEGATLGSGTLTITVAGESMALAVGAGTDTLAAVRDAINGAADNPGVSATLLNVYDDAQAQTVTKLVLTARETGAANAIAVSVQDGDGNHTDALGLSALATPNLTQLSAAQDALVWIDGQKVVSATNTVADAIDGVTLTLKSVSASRANPETGQDELVAASLGVTIDRSAAKGLVQGFVTAYNAMVDALKGLDNFNPSTRQSSTLFGDSAVRNLSAGLRRALGQVGAGLDPALATLADLGVTTGADGKLTVDAAKLDETLARNLEGVARVFAGEGGLAGRLQTLVEAYVGSDGVLESRTDGLDRRVRDIGRQRDTLARRMEALEARLLKQFTAMDELVGRLQSTSSFLTQQLASLQTFTSGRSER